MAFPRIPNIANGRAILYAELAKTQPSGFSTAFLEWILLANASLESDATMIDHETVAAILAGTSNEASFTNYARIPVAAADIVVAPDHTANDNDFDITTNPNWTNPGSVEAIGAIVLAFSPAAASADSAKVPLFLDAAADSTEVGVPFIYNVASPNGLMTGVQG